MPQVLSNLRMMRSPDNEKRILAILDEAPPRGFSIEELSTAAKLSRGTVSKNVAILEAKDRVEIEKVGPLKLVRLLTQ